MAAGSTNDETFVWSVKLSLSAPAWRTRPPTNDEMRRARYYSFGKVCRNTTHLLDIKCASSSTHVEYPVRVGHLYGKSFL